MIDKNIPSLFDVNVWDEWIVVENQNYVIEKKGSKDKKTFLKKGYNHFDHRIWFPDRANEVLSIVSSLKNLRHHTFLPFLKTIIKTPRLKYSEEYDKAILSLKPRPICFASHLDALIHSFFAFSLNKTYQQYINQYQFTDCVLAYRTDLNNKCNIQFTKEVFDEVRKRGNCTALSFDIKGYFDNIDHAILKQKWLKVIRKETLPDDQYTLYKRLTKYSYVNKNSILKQFNIDLNKRKKEGYFCHNILDLIDTKISNQTFQVKFQWLKDNGLIVTNTRKETLSDGKKRHYGIPQGSAMSAVLSNIYLVDFDCFLYNLGKRMGFTYRRYCDDLVIICSSEKANTIEEIVLRKISKYKVRINESKTEKIIFQPNSIGKTRAFNKRKIEEEEVTITPDNENQYYKSLQYLGFEFDGQRIYVRPSSLSRYFRKMKARINKTVNMAYSENSKADKIFKHQLFSRYSHLGKRNFLTYVLNASKEYYTNAKGENKEGLNSPCIRKQVAKHMKAIEAELAKKSKKRFHKKSSQGYIVSLKK